MIEIFLEVGVGEQPPRIVAPISKVPLYDLVRQRLEFCFVEPVNQPVRDGVVIGPRYRKALLDEELVLITILFPQPLENDAEDFGAVGSSGYRVLDRGVATHLDDAARAAQPARLLHP